MNYWQGIGKMHSLLWRFTKLIINFITNFIPIKKHREAIRVAAFNKAGLFLLAIFSPIFHFKNRMEQRAGGNENKTRQNLSPMDENYLIAVSCIKNEAPYLKEWIEYHRMLGVEKFYFYDNESTDNTLEILNPYISSGIAVFCGSFKIENTFIKTQKQIYTKAVKSLKNKTKWALILDIDEFVVPNKCDTLIEFLRDYERFNQITITWKNFGTGGHKIRPKGLVIENYFYRKSAARFGKSIVKPKSVIGLVGPHYSMVWGRHIDENKNPYIGDWAFLKRTTDIIAIHHYSTKSEEEFYMRRGQGAILNIKDDTYDNSIERFIAKLKARL
jgi:hypothetical protein